MMMRLAKFLPDSIAGRALAVLLIGLSISHLASIATYHFDSPAMERTHADGIADRLVAARSVLAATNEDARAQMATLLSTDGFALSLTTDVRAAVVADPATTARLKDRLDGRLPPPDVDKAFAERREDHNGVQITRMAVPLTAGQWVLGDYLEPPAVETSSHSLLLSTGVMATAVLILSAMMIRAALAPLRTLGRAAERLGVDVTAPPMAEDGPREIRQAAHAFNGMQARIKSLIDERTQMLAALSHDLRTSLTVMHLRTEFIEDDDLRDKLQANISDMEKIVVSTLALLRDEQGGAEGKLTNLAELVRSLCADLADAGQKVSYTGLDHALLTCRPTVLKRAFTNLIDNALKYGDEARVSLERQGEWLLFRVADSGPGIPDAEMVKVFTPFYRIEPSRNQDTGGFGLGLAIVRSAARLHGGDVALENPRGGGLRVTISLAAPLADDNSEPKAT
jgi:signal transduction histidine kinase